MNVIPGFGRGYQGTTASPHAQYAPVTLSPTFPRNSIKKAINDTINSFYPKLWISTALTPLPLTHLRLHTHYQMTAKVSCLSLGRLLVLAKSGYQ
jgi:hypothetical protein